jgi:uncharacterized membrane protein
MVHQRSMMKSTVGRKERKMDRNLSEEALLSPEEHQEQTREWTLFGRRVMTFQRKNQWKVLSLALALVLCTVLVSVVVIFTTVMQSSTSFYTL